MPWQTAGSRAAVVSPSAFLTENDATSITSPRRANHMTPVTAIAVSSKSTDLRPLARALRLHKGSNEWRRLKGGADRYRLRCPKCGGAALELVNEPCVRRRHKRTAHKRRTVARCLVCRNTAQVMYGA